MKKNITCLLLAMIYCSLSAQEWVGKMNDPSINFYEVQRAFENEFKGKSYERGKGIKQFRRWEYFMAPRVYPSGNRMNIDIAWKEVKKFQKQFKQLPNKQANWGPLGPEQWQSVSYNPGIGRVNCVRVDPNDPLTIYVGTPAGGCWRSQDGGC